MCIIQSRSSPLTVVVFVRKPISDQNSKYTDKTKQVRIRKEEAHGCYVVVVVVNHRTVCDFSFGTLGKCLVEFHNVLNSPHHVIHYTMDINENVTPFIMDKLTSVEIF